MNTLSSVITKSSTLLLALAACVLAVGCAAQEEEDGDESGAAVSSTSASAATLTTKSINAKVGRCTSSGTELSVDGLGSSAEKRINDALANQRGKVINASNCESTAFTWTGSMSATLNAKGFLSVAENGAFGIAGKMTPFFVGHTFDLSTGNALKLTDIVTNAGVDLAFKECERLTASGGVECETSLTDYVRFTVEKGGLRVHAYELKLDPTKAAQKAGVLIAWSVIEGSLKTKGVALRNASR